MTDYEWLITSTLEYSILATEEETLKRCGDQIKSHFWKANSCWQRLAAEKRIAAILTSEQTGHALLASHRNHGARMYSAFGCTQPVVSPFFFFFVVAALHCKALPTDMSLPDSIIFAFMRRYLDTCGCPFWQEFHILNISFSVIPAKHNRNKSTNGTEVLLPEQMAGGTSIHPLLKVSSITRVSCHFCQHEHTWREQGPLGHCITMITRYSTLRACMGH